MASNEPSLEAGRMSSPVSVIGGAGFIGRNLIDRLTAIGVPVSVFTRQAPFVNDAQPDPGLLASEVVFYVAGSITPALAEREPGRIDHDHRVFSDLLGVLRECDHRPLVVLASSGGTVYDLVTSPPFSEDTRTGPISAYGKAKLNQEDTLRASSEWITPVVLRLANVYGPGQSAGAGYGVIAHWANAVHAREPLTMIGQSRRDYLHVRDATSAMIAVYRYAADLRAVRAPTTLNIGSGVPTSLEELHDHLERVLGRSIPVRRQPARGFDRRDVWLDVTLAERMLGWGPEIGLAEGLADTVLSVLGTSSSPPRFG